MVTFGDVDPGAGGTSHVRFTRTISAAALSGTTVWVPGSTPGTLTQIDRTTQHTVQTVTTDAPCTPSELQAAAQHWVYWSCGPSGPAGGWAAVDASAEFMIGGVCPRR
ncbi:hypothetical protein [Streptomyces sp. NPDC046942]|uniref:hypothetical protein n=1 Tax=Streptomyces sp. NPDC046942 TaxID=3155137 RepID=UPI0033F2BD3A